MRTRRDDSPQAVPFLAWQHAIDAQDTVLWALTDATDAAVVTDGFGKLTLAQAPIGDTSHLLVKSGDVPKARDYAASIVATRDSDGATLYATVEDPVAGNITLYTDSGRTTAAGNETVTVVYPVPRRLEVDANGRLLVSTGETAGATQDVRVVDPLPAGTALIGKVDINGPDSGYADGLATPATVIPVATLPLLYNGDGTSDRVRNADVFKSGDIAAGIAGATAALWTNAGWRVAIRGYTLSASQDVTVRLRTSTPTNWTPPIHLAAGVPHTVELPNVWIAPDAGNLEVELVAIRDGAADANVSAVVWGTQE